MARLPEYEKKRDFSHTPEPAPGGAEPQPHAPRFVVHKHHARALHYDLRLEIEGALASWSVPRGPTFDPAVKRLAVQTEDHPLEYGDFEGRIPDGQYGAGDSLLWDRGQYETVPSGQAAAQRKKGHLRFVLRGEKLRGEWHLVRTTRADGRRAAQGDATASGPKAQWLLFKVADADADPGLDVVTARPESVLTGRVQMQGPGRGGSPANAPKPSMPKLLAGGVLGEGGATGAGGAGGGSARGAELAGLANTPAVLLAGPLFARPHPERLRIDVARPRDLLALPASLFALPPPVPVAAAGARSELVVRLDGQGAGSAALGQVAEVAQIARGFFAELGLVALCSIAGPRSLHLRVALASGQSAAAVERFARRVAETLAASLQGLSLAGARGAGGAPAAGAGAAGAQAAVVIDPAESAAGAQPPELLAACVGATKLRCVPLAWDEVTVELSPGRFTAALAKRRARRSAALLLEHRANTSVLPAAR